MYCPNGTKYNNEYKCPLGTYNNNTGLNLVGQCAVCPGGYYCDEEGQTTFTKKCSPGRFFFTNSFWTTRMGDFFKFKNGFSSSKSLLLTYFETSVT